MRANVCLYCGSPFQGGPVCQHCTQRTLTSTSPSEVHTASVNDVNDETHPARGYEAEFTHDSLLVVQLNVGKASYIVVRVNSAASVGRSDEDHPNKPTIDFAAYRGLEYGVSRTHARIARCDNMLTLTDLGSRNGTYINEQLCRPHSDYLIRDHDEIMFGRLKTRIHFRSESMLRQAAALRKR